MVEQIKDENGGRTRRLFFYRTSAVIRIFSLIFGMYFRGKVNQGNPKTGKYCC